jgi:hypothetical protein
MAPLTANTSSLAPLGHPNQIHKRVPQYSPNCTTMSPPPQWAHVDLRTKTKKTTNLNSPKFILFAIQRKNAKFPQNIFLHLVTQFPVVLRVFPFSEISPKKPILQKLSNSLSIDPILSHFSWVPFIKGRRADLIFYRHPFQLTYLPIFFFIQNPFSHKFLKLF